MNMTAGVSEYLGYMPTVEELEAIRAVPFLSTADAPPAPGDEPHFRYKIGCPRPSCPLDHQLVDRRLQLIKDGVRALWDAGVSEFRAVVSRPFVALN